MPPKKKRKILTSQEVLKDIQKFLDEEDNEIISDEDVNLDEIYGEKSTCQTVSWFLHSLVYMSLDAIMY